jgi:hypothetical protein
MPSQIFILGQNYLVEYAPACHALWIYKFLYWEDEAGVLLLACDSSLARHKNIIEQAKKRGLKIPNSMIQGAGSCKNGEVVSWRSVGLNITTPRELQPKITNLLFGLK